MIRPKKDATARAREEALLGDLIPEVTEHLAEQHSGHCDAMDGQARLAAFQQSLQQLGWSIDRNLRMDTRYGGNDVDRARRYAAELVALAPDIMLASGTVSVTALQHATRTIPIVFAAVADPVGAGVVDTLARPGGNVTGFMN